MSVRSLAVPKKVRQSICEASRFTSLIDAACVDFRFSLSPAATAFSAAHGGANTSACACVVRLKVPICTTVRIAKPSRPGQQQQSVCKTMPWEKREATMTSAQDPNMRATARLSGAHTTSSCHTQNCGPTQPPTDTPIHPYLPTHTHSSPNTHPNTHPHTAFHIDWSTSSRHTAAAGFMTEERAAGTKGPRRCIDSYRLLVRPWSALTKRYQRECM
jgi:hypothetical protein